MKINQDELYRLIIQENFKDLELTEDKVDDLIAHIQGGPRPDWMDDDRPIPDPPEVPKSVDADETYPMDIPSDDAPESEYQGFQNDAGADIETQLASLIHGMDPEAVAELFQTVFEKIPGVELSTPGEETLYSPGAEGRPKVGFREQLMEIIKEELQNILDEEENNPWAICTASVGREDKEKYEKCVKSVKKQNRGKK